MPGIGIDGCTHGWFFVRLDGAESSFGVASRLVDLPKAEPTSTMLIDIPIGLPDEGSTERLSDLEARKVLTPHRTFSVFPVPSRAATYADSYEEACERNEAARGKRLSRQSWAIVPKIREVDSPLRARAAAANTATPPVTATHTATAGARGRLRRRALAPHIPQTNRKSGSQPPSSKMAGFDVSINGRS